MQHPVPKPCRSHVFAWLAAGCLLLPGTTRLAAAENWPQFRGPRANGTSLDTTVPLRWGPSENLLWKTAIPGEGHSSPIVWGEAVFLTAVERSSGKRLLIRLNAQTGQLVWQKEVFAGSIEPMHSENSSASSTPATDGVHLFTTFQRGDRVDLRCFNLEGDLVWQLQPLGFEGEHGFSYSPILHGDLLFLDCRQEGEAALLALDKKNGAVRWRREPSKRRISHVPPLLVEHEGQWQLVVTGSNETRAFHPQSGEPIWWCQGPSDVAVAGLVYGDGMLFATAGYPARTRMGIRLGGRGDVTGTHVAWSLRRQVTYVPGPVYHQGSFYTVLDEGMLYCIDPATGEPRWDQRLGGRFRASLVVVQDHILAINDQGVGTVFKASPMQFERVATNELKEFCYATPAISRGKLYLRTGTHLYCFGRP